MPQRSLITDFFTQFMKRGRLREREQALPDLDPQMSPRAARNVDGQPMTSVSDGVSESYSSLAAVATGPDARLRPGAVSREVAGTSNDVNSCRPEIAVLVSTYRRPGHLKRALLSMTQQRGIAGRFEVVVTDDGSDDETPEVVADFASLVDFPVRLTTHRHETFQLARCRNEGVLVSTAPYLLFVDGDCVLPPDHLLLHLQRRRRGVVVAGDCCRLDEATSNQIDESAIREGRYLDWVPQGERARLLKQHRQAVLYGILPHPRKPKLIGNNIGIWREDYERVNGYDEEFEGWGCEDDDLARRVRRAGLRIVSIMKWTHAYHMWHPTDTTCPATWRQGANVQRLLDKRRPAFCRKGLVHLDAPVCDRRTQGELANADDSSPSRRPFFCDTYPGSPPTTETRAEKDAPQQRVA